MTPVLTTQHEVWSNKILLTLTTPILESAAAELLVSVGRNQRKGEHKGSAGFYKFTRI